MSPKDLEALWQEYRDFWYPCVQFNFNTDHDLVALQHEYQADWLEDHEGQHR